MPEVPGNRSYVEAGGNGRGGSEVPQFVKVTLGTELLS